MLQLSGSYCILKGRHGRYRKPTAKAGSAFGSAGRCCGGGDDWDHDQPPKRLDGQACGAGTSWCTSAKLSLSLSFSLSLSLFFSLGLQTSS